MGSLTSSIGLYGIKPMQWFQFNASLNFNTFYKSNLSERDVLSE